MQPMSSLQTVSNCKGLFYSKSVVDGRLRLRRCILMNST